MLVDNRNLHMILDQIHHQHYLGFEEERRVFYVAVTRSKDQLYLISPSMVQGFRGEQIVRISPFISELNPKVYQKSSVKFKSTVKRLGTSPYKNKKSLFRSADELLHEKEPIKKKQPK